MKNLTTFLLLPCLLPATLWLLAAAPTLAYWPTTLEENLPIAANPANYESDPTALAYPSNSTLVVFYTADISNAYQIIDRFGNFAFPSLQPLTPSLIDPYTWAPKVIVDGNGGAYAVWKISNPSPNQGMWAQHLDSLGNRLWGDSGLRVFPMIDSDYNICSDSAGGFFFAITINQGAPNWNILIQHILDDGQLAWGDSGIVALAEPYTQRYPRLAPDEQGGFYLVWEDWRPPYNYWGSLFRQRFNSSGQPVWSPASGIFICDQTYIHEIIPDGQNGFLLHANPGGYMLNTVFRFGPSGNQLWNHSQISAFSDAALMQGEAGHFYLGYMYQDAIYGQRLDLQGNTSWGGPGWLGAQIARINGWFLCGPQSYAYRNGYFYASYQYTQQNNIRALQKHYVQAVDSMANRRFGNSGVQLSYKPAGLVMSYQESQLVIDGAGGIVSVWEFNDGSSHHDLYAKRCNADGSLGGPFPLEVTLTPHSPPIQIPPSGGSFQYDLEIADTVSVGGSMDAWIEVTLPSGAAVEVLARNNIPIQPGQVLSRTNLQQFVPAGAPAGTYTYTLYAGDHDYNSPWGEDSFTFEKLGDRGWSDRTPSEGQGTGKSEWIIRGWDEPTTDAVTSPKPVD